MAPPVLLVKELLLQELLVVLLRRASVTKRELPAHTAAAHSSELKKATPRSMVSTTFELTLAPPVLLVKELLLQELLVLLLLLLLPRASVMKRELSVHTAAAHSSELKKATPRSMVSMTSELTLAPPVLLVKELLVVLLPRASVTKRKLPLHTEAAHSSKQ